MKMQSRIVIVGGGFAGALCARLLARRLPSASVTLIDDSEELVLPARIPDVVADDSFPAGRLTAPFGVLARRHGYAFLKTRVTSVDRDARELVLANGSTLPYDYLVVTIGARDNFFGVPGAREYTAPYWSYEDAVAMHQRAVRLPPGSHIVVVGGGPTGTELCGSLAQATRGQGLHLTLLTALPEVMSEVSAGLRRQVVRLLSRLNVKMIPDALVTSITPDVIRTRDGRTFPTQLTVWAGGICSAQLSFRPPVELDKAGYFLVDPYLRIDKHIFGGGDCVLSRDPLRVAPKTGQHARQMAIVIAENIARTIAGRPLRAYRPYSQGTLLAYGSFGILDLGKLRLTGRVVMIMRDLIYRIRLREIVGRWPR